MPKDSKTTSCSRIYTVDDDYSCINLWCQFEADGAFPGIDISGSDSIAAAMADAEATTDATLYVMDARMPLDRELFDQFQVTIKKERGIDIANLPDSALLNGVFAAAWIKIKNPNAKVILLTAFFNSIKDLARHSGVERLLAFTCDLMLPKPSSESIVRRAIGEFVTAHGAARDTTK